MNANRYREISELAQPDLGRVHRSLYANDEIHRVELERIFARCWLFIGHESQLKNPGDFVTTWMGEDPVILTRDTAGQINVLLNNCPHKGRTVCTLDQGNTKSFICPYHGWGFGTNGALRGIPYTEEAYYGEVDRDGLGLKKAAKVETFRGLIFATWDQEAPSLEAYLGDMAWYLDIALDRSEGGTELVGPPQKFIVKANWKTGAENFISDFQHAQTIAHRSAIAALNGGEFPGGSPPSDGIQANAGPGHGLFLYRLNDEPRTQATRGFMQANTPDAVARLGELRGSGTLTPIAGTVFPNLSFNMDAGFPNLRMWMPKGPHEMELWTWGLVDAAFPAETKMQMIKGFQMMFGVGGVIEQDDGDQWQGLTEGARGFVGGQQWSHITMGLGHEFTDPDLPGELGQLISESNVRAFYRRWRDLIAHDNWQDMPLTTHRNTAA